MTYDTRERDKIAFDVTTTPPTDGQALRDVPSQSGFPYNVVWPTQP